MTWTKEKQKACEAKWYLKNKEKKRKYAKERHLRLLANPDYIEKYKTRSKEYYHKNRDKINKRRLKLRFEIFKRDKFICQYCGRKSPNVILQIDHIYPKSKGGLNNINNYKTACMDCNIGKSDFLL